MTKEFIEKVLNKFVCYTKKYRYCAMLHHGVYGIYRLPIIELDTTYAIDGWELVKMKGYMPVVVRPAFIALTAQALIMIIMIVRLTFSKICRITGRFRNLPEVWSGIFI